MLIVFNMPDIENHPWDEAAYWGSLRGACIWGDLQLAFVVPPRTLEMLGIYVLVTKLVEQFILQLDRSN